jgi:hypothetical protein
MIDPKDPSLPKIWQAHPFYTVHLATLSRQGSKSDEPDPLEQTFPGWYISHDLKLLEVGPDMDGFDSLEAFEAHLEENPDYLQEAIQQAQHVFATHDFRRAEGLMKLFAGRAGGFLEPDQRRRLASDIAEEDAIYSNPEVVRKAFVELEGGFAVAGAIVKDKAHLIIECGFASSANPLLTLLGREVVVRTDTMDHNQVLVRGLAELEGNSLIVGDWRMDFTDGSVYGMPFESVELEAANQDYPTIYEVYEAKYFDEEVLEEQ